VIEEFRCTTPDAAPPKHVASLATAEERGEIVRGTIFSAEPLTKHSIFTTASSEEEFESHRELAGFDS
jgi:hypothetical protein